MSERLPIDSASFDAPEHRGDRAWGSACPYVVGIYDCAGRFGERGFPTFAEALAYAKTLRFSDKYVDLHNRDECDGVFDGLTDDEREAFDGR